MPKATINPGSYLDPAGQVFHLGERVLRGITRAGAADYTLARDSGLIGDLVKRELLVKTDELNDGATLSLYDQKKPASLGKLFQSNIHYAWR